MSLRSHLRAQNALRPFTILLATLAACTAPGCGGDGGEDSPVLVDAGDETNVETGATDTGVATDGEVDSGAVEIDSGAIEMDTGVAEMDTGAAEMDSGATEMDTGSADPDTGSVAMDTGVVDMDTGVMDTGAVDPDTGAVEMDTGVVVVDSGPADTGAEDTGPEDTGFDAGPVVPTVKQLALGGSHTCALMTDKKLYCWGSNDKGQLGDGTRIDRASMPTTPTLTDVEEVGLGEEFSCARMSDRTVKCWGYYFYGSLGDGRVSTSSTVTANSDPNPVTVTGVTDATQLFVGHLHACIIDNYGHAKCWGYNSDGQLGGQSNGTTKMPTAIDVKDPAGTGVMNDVASMTLGRTHTCLQQVDGTTYCFGNNTYGETGDGTLTDPRLKPATPIGLTNVKQIEAGNYHTCALHNDGTVSCWGTNYYGSIGDGSTMGVGERRPTPVKLGTINNVAKLALGENYSCAILFTREIKCWGEGSMGQLGDGRATDSNTPVSVAGINNAVDIMAGYSHVCARLIDGRYRCWGSDASGQLGLGTVFNYNTPTRDPGLSSVTQLAMSGQNTSDSHGCAVLADKSLKCWGRGREGQLGLPTLADSFVPVVVPGVTAAEQVVTGERHTCVRLTGGSVSCFGDNQYGVLGGGGTAPTASTPTSTAVAVSGISTAVHVATGARFSCALLADKSVSCWGRNDQGQLALPSTTASSATPVKVAALADVAAIAAGGEHACAISALDGSVSCWGQNDNYQSGNSASTTDVRTPVKLALPSGTTAVKLALGENHTCVLLSDKTVACFGDNQYGQIGNGTTTDVKTPTVVAGLAGVANVWSGDNFVCTKLETGATRCWGYNVNGQLADGSFDNRSTPGPGIVGLSNWVDLALGRGSACAELADGTARCWGGIYNGALGDGEGKYRGTPVTVTF